MEIGMPMARGGTIDSTPTATPRMIAAGVPMIR